jgi:hypothetical protein
MRNKFTLEQKAAIEKNLTTLLQRPVNAKTSRTTRTEGGLPLKEQNSIAYSVIADYTFKWNVACDVEVRSIVTLHNEQKELCGYSHIKIMFRSYFDINKFHISLLGLEGKVTDQKYQIRDHLSALLRMNMPRNVTLHQLTGQDYANVRFAQAANAETTHDNIPPCV